jgi:hypothetical protein
MEKRSGNDSRRRFLVSSLNLVGKILNKDHLNKEYFDLSWFSFLIFFPHSSILKNGRHLDQPTPMDFFFALIIDKFTISDKNMNYYHNKLAKLQKRLLHLAFTSFFILLQIYCYFEVLLHIFFFWVCNNKNKRTMCNNFFFLFSY